MFRAFISDKFTDRWVAQGSFPQCTARLIKESTGKTFLQIIRDIKLNQACHALRETSLSNLAICELVGYESPEHFMRTFKKTYRMTPGETGRRTGNKRLQDLIYFLYNRCRSGRYLSYPPL
jgi:AraC-like DNA-binding protein